ncbi:mannose-6-phosphate isomerase, class I [Pengzhenrongella frigida]|uniref:mannose-6-phosphate isomerase n=1 Tax=Pengzhenrongella frigida TaxID=1259133 RepID=A0A4Q5N070_9MICO|nr:mannose-6-phosphate isomerase, class I [Cellulomonas sp. HLT2-17]RYV51406.1 mannose-6-phosphate isomerase, class I [Cellulomonas sp. HLT2-17]
MRLINPNQPYAWGSVTAIPGLLGMPVTSQPVAESWMGAHPSAPSRVATGDGEVGLDALIADDADVVLGADVVARFGPALPYLLKLLAAEGPLSLQVHPQLEQARKGHAAEEAAGVPVDAPHRNYRDTNHKPELVFALTPFEAICGFRAPRRAAEILAGLDAPLAQRLYRVLAADPTSEGIRAVFTQLLEPAARPTPAEVLEVAQACAARLADGSTSPRADRIVISLAEAYPGDPGVVTSLLLNPVTLQPGDAMFIPAGGVHAYLRGFAVEVMASSDNVLRAGLTPKHIDVEELLRSIDYVAAPPIRIAPEVLHGSTRVFYAPVDDFELSVTEIADDARHPVPGRGPRILLCLEGELDFSWGGDDGPATLTLRRGQSAFAPASDGPLTVRGNGTVVQADVP